MGWIYGKDCEGRGRVLSGYECDDLSYSVGLRVVCSVMLNCPGLAMKVYMLYTSCLHLAKP